MVRGRREGDGESILVLRRDFGQAWRVSHRDIVSLLIVSRQRRCSLAPGYLRLARKHAVLNMV